MVKLGEIEKYGELGGETRKYGEIGKKLRDPRQQQEKKETSKTAQRGHGQKVLPVLRTVCKKV